MKAQQQEIDEEENGNFPALSKANLENSKPAKVSFEVDMIDDDEDDMFNEENFDMNDIVRCLQKNPETNFSASGSSR